MSSQGPKTVILADDDTAIRTVLTQALTRAGYEVRATGNAITMWRMVAEGEGDIVITDVVLPDENAFEILPRIKKARPNLPVIVMSAKNTIMTAITAAERGAYEYLPKPFDLKEMLSVVEKGLEQASRGEKSQKPRRKNDFDEDLPLVGRSPAMQDIYRVIARMTQTDLTVMIIGESGTGKELVARALHDYSRRKQAPFVAVNMAAIPRELIESELFGHEKGAFTGASARYAGRFEQAQGGTLFLDEIGDMPMEAQTRLLRVLQEGEFSSVGGSRPRKTDVRVIAATHRDLRQLIKSGKFREDLYFRLNVVPLRLPPLRERLGDIGDLVQSFLQDCEKKGLPRKTLTAGAIERLGEHKWPGNVRELENLIQRLVAIQPDEEIDRAAVEAEFVAQKDYSPLQDGDEIHDLSAAVEKYLAGYFAGFGDGNPP
ncbi:MAG TPA: nitrogen regulation protein NR(I), partial [Rhizobiales bacterium]|nr:nitrogen regulation protein NR(I) [Hyphomicrobiales bacterium]